MADLGSNERPGTQPWPSVISSPAIPWVLAASTALVLPYNNARKYLLVVNGSGNTGMLGIGETASATAGIPLLPYGSYEMTQGAGNCDPSVITIYGTGTFYVKEGY